MDTTITLGDAGMILIGIGLIFLIFYSVILVRSLIPAVKSLTKVLENADRVVAAAANGAEETERMLGEVKGSVATLVEAFKGNQNIFSAATTFINAVAALKRMVTK